MKDKKEKKFELDEDQKKVDRIVTFINEFYNEVEEGYTALNTISKDQMLQYIKEIDFAMHRIFVEVCGDIGYAPSKDILKVVSTFIEEEKKKLEVGSDRHDLVDSISKIIQRDEG